MSTLIGEVTDDTPGFLEYGTYRGYVQIDGETGEFLVHVTDEERRSMHEVSGLDAWSGSTEGVTLLGPPVYSECYADLRPVLVDVIDA